MTWKFAAGMLVLATLIGIGARAEQRHHATYKVVFDVGEGGNEHFQSVIAKTKNLMKDSRIKDRLDLKIVVHSGELDFAISEKNRTMHKELEELRLRARARITSHFAAGPRPAILRDGSNSEPA